MKSWVFRGPFGKEFNLGCNSHFIHRKSWFPSFPKQKATVLFPTITPSNPLSKFARSGRKSWAMRNSENTEAFVVFLLNFDFGKFTKSLWWALCKHMSHNTPCLKAGMLCYTWNNAYSWCHDVLWNDYCCLERARNTAIVNAATCFELAYLKMNH